MAGQSKCRSKRLEQTCGFLKSLFRIAVESESARSAEPFLAPSRPVRKFCISLPSMEWGTKNKHLQILNSRRTSLHANCHALTKRQHAVAIRFVIVKNKAANLPGIDPEKTIRIFESFVVLKSAIESVPEHPNGLPYSHSNHGSIPSA